VELRCVLLVGLGSPSGEFMEWRYLAREVELDFVPRNGDWVSIELDRGKIYLIVDWLEHRPFEDPGLVIHCLHSCTTREERLALEAELRGLGFTEASESDAVATPW